MEFHVVLCKTSSDHSNFNWHTRWLWHNQNDHIYFQNCFQSRLVFWWNFIELTHTTPSYVPCGHFISGIRHYVRIIHFIFFHHPFFAHCLQIGFRFHYKTIKNDQLSFVLHPLLFIQGIALNGTLEHKHVKISVWLIRVWLEVCKSL